MAGSARGAFAWLVVAGLVLPACTTGKIAPIGAGGKAFTPEAGERALWSAAEKEEEAIPAAAAAYEDPLLQEYLVRVGDRVIPESVKRAGGPGFTYDVIKDPSLNAFAMPNGRIYVHTGLLSRLANEAQLATILAHEWTHVTHRHALRYTRNARTSRIVESALGVVGPIASAILGRGLQLAAIAAITGYGGDLEREADVETVDRLVQAGYDPAEASRVFALLQRESRDRDPREAFFLGSHPRLQERIDSTRAIVQVRYAGAAPGGVRSTEEFELRMRSLVRDNAALDARAGRFDLARDQLDRVLAITPEDPVAHLYYGDVYRLQSQRVASATERAELSRKALASYERAVELDPSYPAPFRQLGLLHYQHRQNDLAREAFEKYLVLEPDAPDGDRVREYLAALGR